MSEETLSAGHVSLPIKPDTTGFGKTLESGLASELGSGAFESLGGSLGKKLLVGFGAVAVGGLIADLVKQSVDAAGQAQLSQAKLQTVIRDSGHTYDAFSVGIEEADSSMRKFGFTNSETQDALGVLTTALGDPKKALDVLGVSADLAKAKNMDLNSAALLVAKAMEGQTRPLKALGIDLPVYAGNAQAVAIEQGKVATAQQKVNDILAKTPDAMDPASKAHGAYQKAVEGVTAAQKLLSEKQSSGNTILQALSDRLKGSASAAADTYIGRQKELQAEWDNVVEKAGKILLPKLQDIVTWIDTTGLPQLDLFVGGWDGLNIGLSNTAAAGQFAHDILKSLVDFIAGAGQELGYVVGFFSGDNINAAAADAERARLNDQLAKVKAQHPGVVAGQPGGHNGTAHSPTANAAGGTYQPRPGGHIVQVAEAGRPETIVDTESLNRAVMARNEGAMQSAPLVPIDLSDTTIDKIARTLAGYVRVQTRQGAVTS